MGISVAVWTRRIGLWALLIGQTAGHVHGAEAPQALRFALIAPQSRQEMEANWGPVLAALGKHLGRPVMAEVSADYAGAIWNLRSGRAQLAWLGNKTAIEAVDLAGTEVFAKETYPSGLGGYYTYLIVPRDSPLASADEVIAKAVDLTFAQGDVNSTSGTVVPGYYLFASRHLEPRKLFKRVVHANHEDNIRAVAEGRSDAATVASLIYDQLGRRDPGTLAATRIVWRSPLIPADPLVRRRDLPAADKERIAAFFFGYGQPAAGKSAMQLAEERRAMDRLDISSFVPSDDGQLVSVRLIEAARQRTQTETDTTLPPGERQRRLADINRRIAQLEGRSGAMESGGGQ
ncbi:phosphonate ABC transporter substrate-binding protein [Paramagnetospirillum magneticum]|uniref:ABC-type phosphate/phosphonate transport system n=1 Tax=Paramagnetospirillum magneticum (strain ATCC 700264 / AMB-1) TaxID=342108 RepID=Q2W8B6_PARM1|nr:phosphonate ABC transporter substrate-binding protein [Paramagnetospirillum magneticum]BAE49909.1 ABC-type phosphate/phosphonate transport system [Paramagnetospirillum magneticum AMB-1]